MKSILNHYIFLLLLWRTSILRVTVAGKVEECVFYFGGVEERVCADGIYDPVRCGEDFECVYSNLCEAKRISSDFTSETCKFVNDKSIRSAMRLGRRTKHLLFLSLIAVMMGVFAIFSIRQISRKIEDLKTRFIAETDLQVYNKAWALEDGVSH